MQLEGRVLVPELGPGFNAQDHKAKQMYPFGETSLHMAI